MVCTLRWSDDCTLKVFSASSFLSPMALRAAARISAALPDLLRDERDGLREGNDGRESERNECSVIHAQTFRKKS